MAEPGAISSTTRDTRIRSTEPQKELTTPKVEPKVDVPEDRFERSPEDPAKVAQAQPNPQIIPVSQDPALKNQIEAERTALRLDPSGRTHADPNLVAAVEPTATAPLPAKEALDRSHGTFELASRELEAGRGDKAAELLRGGATELRRSIPGANPTEARALTTLADNMDARAALYGENSPKGLREKASALVGTSWDARKLGEELAQTNPALSQKLTEIGTESRLQAELGFHAAANTDALLGQGVSQTYRAITNASFDRAINDTGYLHNLFTGKKEELTKDKAKVNEVFDYIDQKMAREGISFDRAWGDMFDNHKINSPDRPPSFPTAHEAAVFLRDHQVTKGLLSPMADISRNLSDGNLPGVDRAKGSLVEALRSNGQWDIARNVLDDLQKSAQSPEGQQRAQTLNDNERGEWWKQKAGEFVQKDLPVLLLSTAVSGGAGLGARALAGAAGWGSRAIKGAQIAAEIGTFVPTQRVLDDVINGRKADWSAQGLARDYAITAGGYGLFHALGAGYRALRAPKHILPDGTPGAPAGRSTPINPLDAKENIKALTRENESATTLAKSGYKVEQNPVIPGGNVPGVKHPDYRIGGEYFDNFAPSTSSARNIWTTVEGKVTSGQARRIVLNLDDSKVAMDQLQKQFKEWPINGLEQVLVVKNGQVFSLPLGKPPTNLPWVTPKGYPNQDN